jgi:UDP:flavonoid glycosyltransferase YjiC (YdhE family)
MLALGRALALRGHEVWIETWTRWRAEAGAEGLRFAPAPEYPVFPTREGPLKPYEAVVRAVATTRPLVARVRPDVVVHDVLTLAPALAAELEGVPTATLVPHVDPRVPSGAPPYSLGARWPRTALGRRGWRAAGRLLGGGLELGRRELDATRGRLGLPAAGRDWGGISAALCLVATFPQLEPPRAWPPGTHVVGPLLWAPSARVAPAEPPPGRGPLVLVAPSTSQDPGGALVRSAIAGLGGAGLRVLAVWDARWGPAPAPLPEGVRLVSWLDYRVAMERCDLVVCHGGHGTLAWALLAGRPVVVVPAGGDMNENAARVDRAGVGVRLPRRLRGPRALRLAVERALARPDLRERAAQLAAWAARHDGPARAAGLLEDLAARKG